MKEYVHPEKRPISVTDLAIAVKHGHSLAVPDHCNPNTFCTECGAYRKPLPKTGMAEAFKKLLEVKDGN